MIMRSLSFVFCNLCFIAMFKEHEAVNLIEYNMNKTATTSSTTTTEIGSLTLAKIIGSIVASFVMMLALQWIIKRYRCKRTTARSSSENEGNSTTIDLEGISTGSIQVTIPETFASPPSYQDIHLYKTINLTSSLPVYYNIPGMKNYYGIMVKANELSGDTVPEEEPPAYVQGSDEEDGNNQSVVHVELVLHSNISSSPST